jgi:hypothetical protein
MAGGAASSTRFAQLFGDLLALLDERDRQVVVPRSGGRQADRFSGPHGLPQPQLDLEAAQA